jgi:glycosyltransferase involved in cell wall biosynthesis
MRVKILDAWSRGVPVVSTTLGAEGIVCRPGEDIMIADTPQAFAEAVAAVLSDAALHERLSREGLRTVRARYDWRTVYAAWDEIYEST